MNKYGISEAKSKVGFTVKAVPYTAVSRTERLVGRFATRVGVLVSAFALVLAGFAPMSAEIVFAADQPSDPYYGQVLGQNDKVVFCHSTGSGYSMPNASINSFFGAGSGQGHDQDQDDIIPPFHYFDDNDVEQFFDGTNWEEPFISIWEHLDDKGKQDCVAPATEPTTGTITVTKVVTNDNGGTKKFSDFSFTVDDGQPTAFEADGTNALTLPFGTYSIAEVADAGYDTTYQGCSNITLGLTNLTATCTITNNDKAPTNPQGSLKIVKNTVGGNGTFTFAIDGYMGPDTATITTKNGTGSVTISNLDYDDAYTITETNLSTGWAKTGETNCTAVKIVANETVTCTFENTYTEPQGPRYDILVKKVVVGSDKPASDFILDIDATQPSSETVQGSVEGVVVTVGPGTFNITEPNTQGYSVEYSPGCSGTLPVPVQEDVFAVAAVAAPQYDAECVVTNTFQKNEDPDPCVDGVHVTIASTTATQFEGLADTMPTNLYDESEYSDDADGNSVVVSNGAWATIAGVDWVSDSAVTPPAGQDAWRLFSHTFTIPAGATAITIPELKFSADNTVVVFLDDVKVAESLAENTYSAIHTQTLPALTPGTHTLKFAVKNSEFRTENPTGLTYMTEFHYMPDCDGGDDSSTSGGGGSGSRRTPDDNGRVLGDSTGLPYQAPQVLGETTELPRTGTPLAIAFSIVGILAIVLIPRYAKVSVK